MIRKNPRGDLPVIHESAFVDPTAIIYCKVVSHENVCTGPYPVIRADAVTGRGDMEPIIIAANSNIQDGVVIHPKWGAAVTIGEYSSMAHHSIERGPCEPGGGVVVGFNPVLVNCEVEAGSVKRHNSVIEGCRMPPGFHISFTSNIHCDAELATIKPVPVDIAALSEDVARTNVDLVKGYKRLANEF